MQISFHFKGAVDGSDKIVISREGALWQHAHWGWPLDTVGVNDVQWNPREKNYLTTAAPAKFLPEPFSMESVRLEVLQGRDVVALERGTNALIVHLNDTPVGASDYEFKIHFQPDKAKPTMRGTSTVAHLKIAAQIDGSDCIKITPAEAAWGHKAWGNPAEIRLNDVRWFPEETTVLKNEGTNTFLPSGIDLSTARILSRKGRDLATMWAEKNELWIWFADNPNGNDSYELEIAFDRQ